MSQFRLGTQNRRRDDYARFSAAEIDQRYKTVRGMMRERGLDVLILWGNAGSGEVNVRYLTNYSPPFATYLVVFADPDEPTLLLVGRSNHLQYVREVTEADEVALMLPNPPRAVIERIQGTDAANGTVGIVGDDPRYGLSVPHSHYDALNGGLDASLVDATVPFMAIHAVKSEAELERIRTAATLTDAGMEALAAAITPGVRETELRDAVARTYLDTPGSLGLAFLSSAPMEGAEPGEPLPWHLPSNRMLDVGDIVTTEMSASYRGYRSQIHRAFVVGRPPTTEYADLWAVAEATYESMLAVLEPGATVAAVHEAMAPLEESSYKSYDVMLHGYGNGYLHPFIGTADSNYWPGGEDPVTDDWTFAANMVVVVQPNVVTPDERLGLQLGSAVVITNDGPEILQKYPVTFRQV